MKTTIELVHWFYKPNKNGDCPIYIRIKQPGRKPKLISTGYTSTPQDWDEEKSQVRGYVTNSAIINTDLDKQLNRAKDTTKEIGTANVAEIKSMVKGNISPLVFSQFAKMKVALLVGKFSANTIRGYESSIKTIALFDDKIRINEITVTTLYKFEHWLRNEKKNSDNTVWFHMKNLSKFINLAIADKYLKKDDNPFNDFYYSYTQTTRTYLGMDEVEAIEKFIQDDTKPLFLKGTAAYFVLCCYCGMRYGDAAKFDFDKNIVNGRLILKPGKGRNSLPVSIPLHTKLSRAIEVIKTAKPLTCASTTARNLYLIERHANIPKHITFHVARHTFAMHCCQIGMSIETVQVLLGHKNIKHTAVYYKITNSRVDADMAKWD